MKKFFKGSEKAPQAPATPAPEKVEAPKITADTIVERAAEIRALAAEANHALKRLKEIKERIESLGGSCHIYAGDTSHYRFAAFGQDLEPIWRVDASYQPSIPL